MQEEMNVSAEIDDLRGLLREKLSVRGNDLSTALKKGRHQLSRRARRGGATLAEAEALAAHPKLSRTLDTGRLSQAAEDLRCDLEAIDVADRRKGWWLGMLGGLVFNLLLFFVSLLLVLRWRGFL